MKKILFFSMIALLCACQTNEPEYLKRPDSSIPHSKYIEPTYEELCAMWDADTTLTNVSADTLTLADGAHYICEASCPAGDENGVLKYRLYSSQIQSIGMNAFEFIRMSIKQWHCGNIPHAGYYTTSQPQDSVVINVPYLVDRGVYYDEKNFVAESAKCMFYNFTRLPDNPNVIGTKYYACAWRILFSYKDKEGKIQYVYTEGHPEE